MRAIRRQQFTDVDFLTAWFRIRNIPPPDHHSGELRVMLCREEMLCFSLGVAMRRVNKIYGEALSEHGITPPQLYILSCLYEDDGQKPRDLAEKVSLDTSSLTGLLDRMERAGLVQRQADPADRRALRVCCTPKGQQTLIELAPVVERLQERVHREFFADYSRDEIDLFLRMLRQVRSAPA